MPDFGGLALKTGMGPARRFFDKPIRCVALYGNFAVGSISAGPTVPANPWTACGWSSIQETLPAPLAASCGAAGFTAFRLVIDPGPLLLASGDPVRTAALTTIILGAVDYILATGARVIVDMHVRPYPAQLTGYGLGDKEIVQAAPGGAFWTTYLAATAALAGAVDAHVTDHSLVAFEVFNEPPFYSVFVGFQPWATSLMSLYSAIRAAAPNLTLLLAGSNDAATGFAAAQDYPSQPAAGLGELAAMLPLLDNNTMAVVHDYNPTVFAFQGQPGFGGTAYVSNLTYPPQAHPGGLTAALASATAYINADTALTTQPARDSLIASLTTSLRAYFGTDTGVPQDGAWMISDPYGLARAAAIADAAGWSRSRIILGEFGADEQPHHYITGAPGASPASKAMFLADKAKAARHFGFGWSVWDLESPYDGFKITDSTRTLVPAYIQALFS